jgi:hypothetical protein
MRARVTTVASGTLGAVAELPVRSPGSAQASGGLVSEGGMVVPRIPPR